MSDYTKLTNFAVKDGYTTGNPAKVIKGTEIDDELNAISTAVATKIDNSDLITIITNAYPVGSIYMNAGVATNPGALLGFGTWTAFGAGRVLLGNGGGFSAGATGGSADAAVVSHTHTATTTVTDPGHSHGVANAAQVPIGTGGVYYVPGTDNVRTSTTNTTNISVATSLSTEGSSGTNANLQPYIVVYMWQRTA